MLNREKYKTMLSLQNYKITKLQNYKMGFMKWSEIK